MSDSNTTVVFDTETTGLIKPDACLLSDQPYIIEIYCLKVDKDLNKIDEFETFIKPPIPLSKEINKITGITDDDLKDAPTFAEIYKDLADFFTGVDTMVAHNLPFDRSMVANDLSRINRVLYFPWPRNHICTVEKTLHIQQRRMSLARLHEHLFGCGFPDAHRAKHDVMALYKCYAELVKRGTIK